jgi:hypothetical protein
VDQPVHEHEIEGPSIEKERTNMPGISIPEFNRDSAIVALNNILEKIPASGEIEIFGAIKAVKEIKTVHNTSRAVLDSDFDRLAVLSGLVRAIGEEDISQITDKEKYKKLLEKARDSQAFRDLDPAERRTINSAYRALAFQGKSPVPLLSMFLDFLSQVWVDVTSSKMPPLKVPSIPRHERDMIETVITFNKNLIAPSGNDNRAVRAYLLKVQDLVGPQRPFDIKNPSQELKDFAEAVSKIVSDLLGKIPSEEEKGKRAKAEEGPRAKENIKARFYVWFRENAPKSVQEAMRDLLDVSDEERRKVIDTLIDVYGSLITAEEKIEEAKKRSTELPQEEILSGLTRIVKKINKLIKESHEDTPTYVFAQLCKEKMFAPMVNKLIDNTIGGPKSQAHKLVEEEGEKEEDIPDDEVGTLLPEDEEMGPQLMKWVEETIPDKASEIEELLTSLIETEFEEESRASLLEIFQEVAEGNESSALRKMQTLKNQHPKETTWQTFASGIEEILTENLFKTGKGPSGNASLAVVPFKPNPKPKAK